MRKRFEGGVAYRRYLRGELHRPMTAESYQQWLACLPFTCEQVAEAYDRLSTALDSNEHLQKRYRFCAALIRRGRLTGSLFRAALSELVKVCAVCGKPALYQQGWSGRCKTHRMVPEAHRLARLQRKEEAHKVYSRDKAKQDANILNHLSAQTTVKFKSG